MLTPHEYVTLAVLHDAVFRPSILERGQIERLHQPVERSLQHVRHDQCRPPILFEVDQQLRQRSSAALQVQVRR
jgi:hypothetical protein